jgi:hypothetical protein
LLAPIRAPGAATLHSTRRTRTPQKTFGQMAATGVARAEDEDRGFHLRHWRLHNSTGSMAKIFLRRAASSAMRGSPASDFATQRIASRAGAEAFAGSE